MTAARRQALLRLCQAAVAALALAACGGGGGGGSGGTAPEPPAAQPPLALTAQNHRLVLDDGLRLADMLLSLAQHAADRLDQLARVGPLPRRLACQGSGEAELADRDGNGALSAGDRVLIRYTNCAEPGSGATLNGRVQIDLLERSPDGQTLRGRISWPEGLGWDASRTAAPSLGRWTGGFDFERRLDGGSTLWRASSPTGGELGFAWLDGSSDFTDWLAAAEVRRELRHASARVAWSASLEVDSPRRGGRYTLATSSPLVAAAESAPDTDEGPARVEVRAANAARAWAEPSATALQRALIAFDAQGDGIADQSAELDWSLLFSGMAWHAAVGQRLFPLDSTRPRRFTTLTNFSGMAQGHLPLRLLFTRPLAAGVEPRFKLFDTGRFDRPPRSTPLELPLDVQRDGALVLLRPRVQPPDSARLELRVSLSDTFSTTDRVRITAADGQWIEVIDGLMGSFHTQDLLRPTISGVAIGQTLLPGQSLALDGSGSADPAWITGYAWTASGGMPLVLSTPGGPATGLRLGPGGVGIGYATVELTLRNAIGQTATSTVRVKAVNPGPSQWLLYMDSEPGEFVGSGRRDWYSEAIGRFAVFQNSAPGGVSIVYDEPGVGATLQLRSADGSPLRPGRYEGARSSGGTGSPYLWYTWYSNACEATGAFEVLEVAYDSQGVLQQLAVDFEQRCSQGLPPIGTLRGALRFNSSRPLPG